ncbi:NTP transferase domain-containing protein [Natrialbaceae archaeon GCM10025810]|uniref:nucleotidyltransferase family protein n=1 Tax=Halovalidus salilacus TaxID=3075124 RepID=UPI00360D6ADB
MTDPDGVGTDGEGNGDSAALPIVAAPDPNPDRIDTRVAGVLLAAGTSSRFGDENKLLARLEGEPVVRRAARTLVAALTDPVIVVLGYDADGVREALEGLSVEFVENEAYAEGQATSVRAGIDAVRATTAACDAGIISLGDMPFVSAETVDRLVAAYDAGVGAALAPAFDGERGNPVLFDRRFFDRLAAIDGDVGGRRILLEDEESVLVAVDDQGVRRDVDVAGDLSLG